MNDWMLLFLLFLLVQIVALHKAEPRDPEARSTASTQDLHCYMSDCSLANISIVIKNEYVIVHFVVYTFLALFACQNGLNRRQVVYVQCLCLRGHAVPRGVSISEILI